MDKKTKDEIQKLQSRIDELKQIANSDMGASFKEAVQTQDMIKMLEIQMAELKESQAKSTNVINEFNLVSAAGEKLTLRITDGMPDIDSNVFSSNSPIGQKLIAAKQGDQIDFRGKKYSLM